MGTKQYEIQQLIGGEWLTMFVRWTAASAFTLAKKLPGRVRVVTNS